MFDVSYAVEVLVFMFAGGVRFHTSVVFLIHTWYSNSSCSCLSYLFLVSPHVVGIGSGYFVVYLLYDLQVRTTSANPRFFFVLETNVRG